jgi:hypothetical protein
MELAAQATMEDISGLCYGLGCVERAQGHPEGSNCVQNSFQESFVNLRFFIRLSIPVFCVQFLHAIHCIVSVSSAEEDPVVEPVVPVFSQKDAVKQSTLLQSRAGASLTAGRVSCDPRTHFVGLSSVSADDTR